MPVLVQCDICRAAQSGPQQLTAAILGPVYGGFTVVGTLPGFSMDGTVSSGSEATLDSDDTTVGSGSDPEEGL